MDRITTTAVIATLAFLASLYGLKYELALLGIATEGYNVLRVWSASQGQRTLRIKILGVLMWTFMGLMFALAPVFLYQAYKVW